MSKTLTKFEIARIKRTAQNLQPYVRKRVILMCKIEELESELKDVEDYIEVVDAPTKALTGGFSTMELVYRDGNSYKLRYPDTVLPPKMKEENPIYNEDLTGDTSGEVMEADPSIDWIKEEASVHRMEDDDTI